MPIYVFSTKLIDDLIGMSTLNDNRVIFAVVATAKILSGEGFRKDIQLAVVDDLREINSCMELAHVGIVSVDGLLVKRLLRVIRNLCDLQESCTISFGIGQTDNLVGALSNLHDEAHVGFPVWAWIDNDLLDLSANERLQNIDK